MLLFILDMEGRKEDIVVEEYNTVGELKQIINEDLGICLTGKKLIYGKTELAKDSLKLSDYGIVNGKQIIITNIYDGGLNNNFLYKMII